MSNEGSDYFSGERLLGLRREAMELGLVTDEFLPNDPDCPVFGINLACAYPFPASIESSYTDMAARLAELSPDAYVYPLWETHVTIMTFLNFSLHRHPSPDRAAELRSTAGPIIELLRSLFDTEKIDPFCLEFRPPVLTRKAVVLPVANATGEIPRIRRRATELLAGKKELREILARGGMNVPGIIHSTIMRFKRSPQDLARFAAGFDAVAMATEPFVMTVNELLLTVETKPYMRGGEIVHRFALDGARGNI